MECRHEQWTGRFLCRCGVDEGNIDAGGAGYQRQVESSTRPWRDGNNGGSFLAIMKTSKYPQEAFEVMKYIQNPENQVQSFKKINLFPSAKDALDAP